MGTSREEKQSSQARNEKSKGWTSNEKKRISPWIEKCPNRLRHSYRAPRASEEIPKRSGHVSFRFVSSGVRAAQLQAPSFLFSSLLFRSPLLSGVRGGCTAADTQILSRHSAAQVIKLLRPLFTCIIVTLRPRGRATYLWRNYSALFRGYERDGRYGPPIDI